MSKMAVIESEHRVISQSGDMSMNRENQDTVPQESRLKHFPITILPTVMGLTGLAIVLFKFEHVFAVNIPLGATVLYAVTAWFAFVLGVYTMKLIRYPDQVKAEFRHPIRVNFFPAISTASCC